MAAEGQETGLSASQTQPLPPPPGSKSEGRKSGGWDLEKEGEGFLPQSPSGRCEDIGCGGQKPQEKEWQSPEAQMREGGDEQGWALSPTAAAVSSLWLVVYRKHRTQSLACR